MVKPLPLLRGEITYFVAKLEEVNVLRKSQYPEQRTQFFTHIASKRRSLKTIVAHHLDLGRSSSCHVADIEDWIHGSFNVCVPVTIEGWPEKQQPGQCVILRFPLSYRVGDAFRPGNGEDSMRGWNIRMDRGELAGRANSLPVWLCNLYRLLDCPMCRSFPAVSNTCVVDFYRGFAARSLHSMSPSHVYEGRVLFSGYMLIKYIEDTHGEMLSKTWPHKQDELELRSNLFCDLSRNLLSITRIPLPKIGSFVIDNNGFLSLTNRPPSIELQGLENDGIPTDIPRDYTYDSVDTYATDLLSCHDSRLQYQPSSINHQFDYLHQTETLAGMQTTSPSFFTRASRHGPFML